MGPVYVRYRSECDCTMRRVRIRSRGDSTNPVSRCEIMGRKIGGWWNGERLGRNID